MTLCQATTLICQIMTKAKEKQGLVLLTIFILKRLSYANERSFSSETLYGLKYIK